MPTIAKPMSKVVVLFIVLLGTVVTVPRANADPYPQPIVTTTSLTVAAKTMWGVGARAKATVSSDAGTPIGSVKFILDGSVRATVALNSNGVAHWRTPARLSVGKHTMGARYVPSSSKFNTSRSALTSFRIVQARTRTTVTAPDIKRGAHPTAKATVTSPNGRTVGSDVVWRLYKGTTLLAKKKTTLRGGTCSVSFRVVGKGRYTVKANYLGNRRYRPSTDSDPFVAR